MFGGSTGISLADIAAVCGNNNDGFGGNNGWWILIILWALWGGRGWNGGESQGAADNYVLASDFATIQRQMDSGFSGVESKLDSVNNGICSLGYDQLGQMNGINTNIANLGYQTATLASGIQAQIADCCCQNREAIAQVRYDMATDTCAMTTAINQAAQNIMQNCNNNYRALHDENVAARLEAKDETIAMLREQLNKRDIYDSNNQQTAQLLAQLRPAPVPAFTVPGPYYTPQCAC